MKLTGSVGIKDGFRFQYQNLIGAGRVTDAMLQAFYSIRNPRARKVAIEQVRVLSLI